MKSCLGYFSILLSSLLFWTGLVPFKINKKMEFKLVSLSSLFTLVRLFIFNFAFLILPLILFYGGPAQKEYEDITQMNFTSQYEAPSEGIIYDVEGYLAYLVYVLPLTLSSVQSKHFNKMQDIFVEFGITSVMTEKSRMVNVKHVLLPLMGFVLFALGKLLNLVHVLMKFGFPLLSINVFCNTCYLCLGHLPLHCLLAVHEHFLYQDFEVFRAMCSWALNANNGHMALIERAKVLPNVMEAIQGAYGLFVLIDIALMLVYWLLHTYHAYFTLQVKHLRKKNCSYLQNSGICIEEKNSKEFHSNFQGDVLPATASVLIILAEFSRVFLLSVACSRYKLFNGKHIS